LTYQDLEVNNKLEGVKGFGGSFVVLHPPSGLARLRLPKQFARIGVHQPQAGNHTVTGCAAQPPPQWPQENIDWFFIHINVGKVSRQASWEL
jgi:hypothetical protein